jgi:4-hydroxy-4-methyl-2-oxoglutarate aldolase
MNNYSNGTESDIDHQDFISSDRITVSIRRGTTMTCESVTDERSRLAALDTATLSDALDRLHIVGQCADIQSRDLGFHLAGRAFTVKYGPAGSPPGNVGDYIDDVAPGDVVVLDNGGRTTGTVWGDILTEVAHARRIGGTVIDGLCRDVGLCRSLQYPVFALGHWMRTGKDRVQVESVGTVVAIGGVRVAPGDFVRGDADGVVVVPAEHATAVLDAAEEIARAEERIRIDVRNGRALREARATHRYHDLQRR